MVHRRSYRRSSLTVSVLLLLSLLLPLVPASSVVLAAEETLTVPFTGGRVAATTSQSYSGPVTITVSGVGSTWVGNSTSDAFYVLTEGGSPITPTHYPDDNLTLWINGQPATNFVALPAYRDDHVYTFTITAPGGQLSFGVGDAGVADNAGAYTITISSQP